MYVATVTEDVRLWYDGDSRDDVLEALLTSECGDVEVLLE